MSEMTSIRPRHLARRFSPALGALLLGSIDGGRPELGHEYVADLL